MCSWGQLRNELVTKSLEKEGWQKCVTIMVVRKKFRTIWKGYAKRNGFANRYV